MKKHGLIVAALAAATVALLAGCMAPVPLSNAEVVDLVTSEVSPGSNGDLGVLGVFDPAVLATASAARMAASPSQTHFADTITRNGGSLVYDFTLAYYDSSFDSGSATPYVTSADRFTVTGTVTVTTDTARVTGSSTVDIDWQVVGDDYLPSATTLTITGTSHHATDLQFQGLVTDRTGSYSGETDLAWDGVVVAVSDLGSGAVAPGAGTLTVAGSYTRTWTEALLTRTATWDGTVTFTFNDSGTADVVVDGGDTYQIDTATGEVVG